MKIIDILNKIARGEEPPKKIVFRNEVYEYDETDGDYRNVKNYDALFDYHEITDILNDEVEILETTIKQDKKIEKLTDNDLELETLNTRCWKYNFSQIKDKINEIIDRYNGE